MSQSRLKIEAARAALKHVSDGMLLGVGTGSTVNAFIDELGSSGIRLEAAVSSSEATTERLKAIGVEVRDLNHTGDLELYIDGADECDPHRRLIKGGGIDPGEDHRRGASSSASSMSPSAWTCWAPFRCRWRYCPWRVPSSAGNW